MYCYYCNQVIIKLNWLLVVGCWLLVVRWWLLVVGCWWLGILLLVVRCSLVVVGCCLPLCSPAPLHPRTPAPEAPREIIVYLTNRAGLA